MLKKTTQRITPFTAGDETLIREVLHPKNDGIALAYSLAFASLEPGQSSKPHVLQRSSEAYIIQKGRGRIFINGETEEVNPGDMAFIPAGARQHIENTGEELLEFWCIVSPPWQEKEEEVF